MEWSKSIWLVWSSWHSFQAAALSFLLQLHKQKVCCFFISVVYIDYHQRTVRSPEMRSHYNHKKNTTKEIGRERNQNLLFPLFWVIILKDCFILNSFLFSFVDSISFRSVEPFRYICLHKITHLYFVGIVSLTFLLFVFFWIWFLSIFLQLLIRLVILYI